MVDILPVYHKAKMINGDIFIRWQEFTGKKGAHERTGNPFGEVSNGW